MKSFITHHSNKKMFEEQKLLAAIESLWKKCTLTDLTLLRVELRATLKANSPETIIIRNMSGASLHSQWQGLSQF